MTKQLQKRFLAAIIGLIVICSWSACYGKVYPKTFMGYDRLTKKMLETLADDKKVAHQPNGSVILRDQYGGAIAFCTDPHANRFEFFRYREVVDDKDTFQISGFGDWGTEWDEYKQPSDIECLDGMHLYLADTDNNRIGRAVFILSTFDVLAESPIATDVGLNHPQGIGLFGNSPLAYRIYLADTWNHRIVKISPLGDLEQSYGSYGSGIGQFHAPSDIARHGDFVYVTDAFNNRVVALLEDTTGSLSWWNTYTIPEGFSQLTSVDYDQNGNVFCVDRAHCKIMKFTEGLEELLWSVGTRGIATNEYLDPRSISVSKSCNDVLVVESYTDYSGFRILGSRIDILEASVQPEHFDATIPGEQTQISFKIDDAAHVTVEILEDGNHVCWMIQDLVLPAGSHSESFLIWDGTDDSGGVCLPGEYQVRIRAVDAYDYFSVSNVPIVIEGTRVTGWYSSAEHWTLDGEPYVLTGDATVSHLTIDAGVKVMTTDNYALKTSGSQYFDDFITANGASGNEILFTQHRKLFPSAVVLKGFWQGIYFYSDVTTNEDTLMLKHCIIEGAGSDTAAIQVKYFGTVILDNCEISRSGSYGYYESSYRIKNSVYGTEIHNCSFEENDSLPIRVAFASICEMGNNSFSDNAVQAIEVGASYRKHNGMVVDQGIPYSFTSDRSSTPSYYFYVGSNDASCVELEIAPGVQLYFDDSTGLICNNQNPNNSRGKIRANGVINDSILFTALDTVHGWQGITMLNCNSADTSYFEYCRISYGGQLDYDPFGCNKANISIRNSPVVITNCNISNSFVNGLDYYTLSGENYSLVPGITNNLFVDNDSCPLVISANWLRSCQNNEFFNNRFSYIYVKGREINSSLVIHAQDIPYLLDGSMILYNNGQPVVAHVDSNVVFAFLSGNIEVWSNCGLIADGVSFSPFDTPSNGQIVFSLSNSDSSRISNCVFDGFPGSAVHCRSTSPTIVSSVIANCDVGIKIEKVQGYGWSKPIIDSCDFLLNRIGVHFMHVASTQPPMRHNTFVGSKCCIKNDQNTVVPASDNWYGHLSGPWDPTNATTGPPDYNPSGLGDSIGDYVQYRPWLISPIRPTTVTLIQPNGGETLYWGQDYEIRWSRTVTSSKQVLYYSTDFPEGGVLESQGTSFWQLIDTVAQTETSYVWHVPFTPSSRCRVAIKIYYEEMGAKSGLSPREKSAFYDESKTGSSRMLGSTISADISDSNCLLRDGIPPMAPYLFCDKSENDIVLTWTKVTIDTLDSAEAMDYYVVYCDTSPSFVPDSLDSVGYTMHPETTYTDTAALSDSNDYFYLVKAVDSTGNKSAKSNMGYKLNKFFNENSGTTDRNWVSLPWHCNYDSVNDVANDLSATGDPLTKITNLRDDQYYESWLWDPDLGEWYGTDFDIISGRGYEMITTKDTSLFLIGSNNPNGLVTLNENPTTTDRNWVSIPYDAAYGTVSDIADEYSPLGNPLTKLTNLRDDNLYESWLWDPDLGEWYGTDFGIERGRGYEFITIIDTTWNPTEYSNEAKGFFLAGNEKYRVRDELHCGASSEPDREPVWVVEQSSDELLNNRLKAIDVYLCADEYRLNSIASVKTIDSERKTVSDTEEQPCKGGTGNTLDEKISHVVRAYIVDARTYTDIAFTAYRLNSPKDVLTENMVGSNTVTQQDLGALWFDVGNFKTPWKGGEEVVLIIEAIKKKKPYIDIEYFKLDETVDIQELGKIELEPSFDFGSQGNEQLLLKRRLISDNIIGYSMYKNDKRLNERILQDERSILPDASVKLVIVGGHETVYGSDGVQKELDKAMPMAFAFAVVPNPFVKQTRIDYALPKQASVEIVIYDVSGRRVKAMVSEMQNAGYYSTFWNGSDDQGRQVACGVYFVRFKAGEFQIQDKVLLVR